MKYNIWMEGFWCTGMDNPTQAHFEGEVEASSFQDACDQWFGGQIDYDSKTLRYWGCNLFDNETDARKNFG